MKKFSFLALAAAGMLLAACSSEKDVAENVPNSNYDLVPGKNSWLALGIALPDGGGTTRANEDLVDGIAAEFEVQSAKLILFNFVSLIVSCVDIPSNNTKYVYQVSFSDAVYKCRLFLLTKMNNSTILNLLLRDLTPIRPNRSFQRDIQSQCLKSLQNRT